MRVNDYDSSQAYYCCSPEWHLWRLKDSEGTKARFAAVLYPFAYRLAKKSGRFFCSAEKIAEHFGVSVWTVVRAMNALTRAGFFIVISKVPFQPSVYEVISHKDWANAHSGHCAVRATFPWSDEKGDELGIRLYTKSGGRVKWFPNILTALRKTGFTDDQLAEQFEVFFTARGRHGKLKSVPVRFLKYLEKEFAGAKAPESKVVPA